MLCRSAAIAPPAAPVHLSLPSHPLGLHFFIYPFPSFSLIKVEEEATDKDNQNCSTDTVCSKVTALQHPPGALRLLLLPQHRSHCTQLCSTPLQWLQAVLLCTVECGCAWLRVTVSGCVCLR